MQTFHDGIPLHLPWSARKRLQHAFFASTSSLRRTPRLDDGRRSVFSQPCYVPSACIPSKTGAPDAQTIRKCCRQDYLTLMCPFIMIIWLHPEVMVRPMDRLPGTFFFTPIKAKMSGHLAGEGGKPLHWQPAAYVTSRYIQCRAFSSKISVMCKPWRAGGPKDFSGSSYQDSSTGWKCAGLTTPPMRKSSP